MMILLLLVVFYSHSAERLALINTRAEEFYCPLAIENNRKLCTLSPDKVHNNKKARKQTNKPSDYM